MRHILKAAPTGWICTRCGQSFGEEMTGEEIMGQECDSSAGRRHGAITGYTTSSMHTRVTWTASREIIDAFFNKHFSSGLRPTSYEMRNDTDEKGSQLLRDAGYESEEEL